MLFLDFGSLWILAYLLLRRLNVVPSIGEKTALSFAWTLGLKSLVIFCWMSGVGRFPDLWVQTGLNLAGLAMVFIFYRLYPSRSRSPSPLPGKKFPHLKVLSGLLGILLVVSFAIALIFPITESDGIWYHIKAMVFLQEGVFDSGTIVSQFRQYPPFLSLLFAYLMAFDIGQVKIIFPLIYCCLLVIFYYRVESFAKNKTIAAAFTLLLGTTPYFWWHSFLPFLDLTTGFFYSVGAMVWFFLIRNIYQPGRVEEGDSKARSLAFISGTLFGLAAWSRLEFLLYDAIPLLLLMYALDRKPALGKKARNQLLICLAAPLLFFSTLWFATLLNFDSPLERRVVAVGFAGLGMVFLVLLNLKWDFRLNRTRLIGVGVLGAVSYFALMMAGGPQSVSLGKALSIALIRSASVHVFYSCTLFMVLFIFKENIRMLSAPEKLLGVFLIFYPLLHFLMFSYSGPKWTDMNTYLEALLVYPGNSINLSDTRGMMAFYPILIFFISGLPVIKKGFENE